jgi:hypothetical protein
VYTESGGESFTKETCIDVDNLIKLKLFHSANQHQPHKCREIHAGGFNRIEEHSFQRTISYLRRTQSFNTGIVNLSDIYLDSSESNDSMKASASQSLFSSHSFNNLSSGQVTSTNNKRISLTDYKTKANTNKIQPTSQSQAQAQESKNNNTPTTPTSIPVTSHHVAIKQKCSKSPIPENIVNRDVTQEALVDPKDGQGLESTQLLPTVKSPLQPLIQDSKVAFHNQTPDQELDKNSNQEKEIKTSCRSSSSHSQVVEIYF